MRRFLFVTLAFVAACGGAGYRGAREPVALALPPSPPPPPPRASAASSAHADLGEAKPMAEVELGLDLRALPGRASPGVIDGYVLGQGDAVRSRAPTDVTVEIRHVPGWGVLFARFQSSDAADALARCRQVIASYLTRAPRLPATHDAAVQVTTPCHAVDGSGDDQPARPMNPGAP